MRDKFDEKVKHTQDSFNDFIATNSEALPIIKSMRERLIDYGDSVVKGLGVENWDGFGKYKENLKWIRAGTEIVICRLTLPKEESQIIAVEVSFDQYLLHWGFCVYRHTWLVEENEKLGVLKKEKLKQYVEGRGFGNEIRESDDSSVVSIRTLVPTGKREEDTKRIRDNFEEIIKGLLGDKKVKEFSPQGVPSGKIYTWGEMLNDYRRKELYDKPDKTPTLLEVARINEKENYISNVLGFFFDEDAPHPLGNIFFRALYELLFEKEKLEEDTEIMSVSREHSTDKNKKIDILIQTNHHVVVIEAKIWARLYNDLADYMKTADDLAKLGEDEREKGKRVVGVVLHIEDNQLTKEEEARAKNLGFECVTYKDLLRRTAQLLVESNYSQLYHKNVDSLYLQLFFDLVTTIENLSSKEKDRREFEKFLDNNGHGYWPRQAVLNSMSFYQSVMNNIRVKVEGHTEHQLKGKFKDWYAEADPARGRAGAIYANERKKYMLGRVLYYETKEHVISSLEKEKVVINTGFDWTLGKWVLSVFLRNNKDIKRQKALVTHLENNNSAELQQYPGREEHDGRRYRTDVESKETLGGTIEMLADLLKKLVTGIETGKPVK